jgi:Predicted phosphohydrolases
MRVATKKFSLVFSCAAFLAAGILLTWLLTREGSVGLVAWVHLWRNAVIGLGIAGILPLVAAAFSLIRFRDEAWKPGAALAAVAIAIAGISIAANALLFGELWSRSRSVQAPIPQANLVDPMEGIHPTGIEARLALSSDPHWGAPKADPAARSSILRSIAAAKPDALLILGDNVDMGLVDSYWRSEFVDIGALLAPVPVRGILGNHDGLVNGQFHYEKYFFPKGMRTDSGSPFYYSMKAGPALVIVMNLLWGSESFDAAQRDWLERTLAANEGRPVIALSHCYFYGSGYDDPTDKVPWYDNKGTIADVAPILERHHVELVVSGHNHYMELLEKNGVTYAIVGAMGGLLDPPPSYVSPASRWFKQGSFGYLDLDVKSEGITLAFRDQDGAMLHEAFVPTTR